MRTLAIETATEACSVALFDEAQLVDARHVELGRGHAERLIPMIRELDGNGRADEIRVSLGPGSFTGVRIGLAAARALGLAWKVRVRGYPTLALMAAIGREERDQAIGVCMNGGHGEWFVQGFDAAGMPTTELASLPPESAVAALNQPLVIGNRAQEFAEIAGREVMALQRLADARHAPSVPVELLSDQLSPVYGRAPDAKVPA